MKRFAQLFVLAACMSVPAIVSADGGLLSPVKEITNGSAEIVEKVPEMVNVSSKGDSITDEVVQPAVKTVTKVVNNTTNTVDKVDQSINESTKPVKPVNEAVETVMNTVNTVEKVVPTEPLKNSEPILNVNLSEKPSVKVDVLNQEVSVTNPTRQEKTEVEIKVPVVGDIVESEPEDEKSAKMEPPSTPAMPVISKDEKEQNTRVQKPTSILQKEVIVEGAHKPLEVDSSGDVRNNGGANLAKDLPAREKKYPDYPASKMLTPSSSQSGQSPSHSTSNGSTSVSSTVAFLAVMDGNQYDSLLASGYRLDGQVRHYFDQWLNAPPGQPPQPFFF